jgi:alkylhydroperoxidase family enzyme
VGGELGVPDEQFADLANYAESDRFDDRERVALSYADGMTITDRDVDDTLFTRLATHFSPDEIVELTAIIAWENASSKFNRALRVPSQQLVERNQARRAERDKRRQAHRDDIDSNVERRIRH